MSKDKIVEVRADIRIRDKDEDNYVLEMAHVIKKTGEYGWSPIAYCGTAKGLVLALRDKVILDAVIRARTEASDQFRDDGWEQWILENLPNKNTKRKEKSA